MEDYSWPARLEPHFYIETCLNCASHAHLYSNHHQEKYELFAQDLKGKIIAHIPELGKPG